MEHSVDKSIWYTHGHNNHDVHQEGDDDDTFVEPDQASVLLQAIPNEIRVHRADEVNIQVDIKEQI
jgi:hypothetical protein